MAGTSFTGAADAHSSRAPAETAEAKAAKAASTADGT